MTNFGKILENNFVLLQLFGDLILDILRSPIVILNKRHNLALVTCLLRLFLWLVKVQACRLDIPTEVAWPVFESFLGGQGTDSLLHLDVELFQLGLDLLHAHFN